MNLNLKYLLALTYIPGLGPINQRKILKIVEPIEIWNMTESELKKIFRKKKDLIPHFLSQKNLELAEREIQNCQKNSIEILDFQSQNYPQKLLHCTDAPLVLFKKGNYQFQNKLHIGIVGTRKMTRYGKEIIKKLMEDLSTQNICMISGLAYGCDIEAHRESIQQNIPNIAVLAHGLHRVSPVAHKKEAQKIMANGALLSEYSSFHNAEPINFVLRNRIIAGLCDALIVIESDTKGGALATAQYANNYNREVFAVPGRVHDKYSRGCNNLIYRNQAQILQSANDLLNYFNLQLRPKTQQTQLFIALESDEQQVFDYLKKHGKQQIDTLALQINLPVYKLNGLLLNMELKGVVKPLMGNFYEIN